MATSRAQLRLRVFLEGREPFDVETRLIDHNTFDTTRARHKWPGAQDAPVTWMGFLAWAASRRSGSIPPELTWEAFLGACEAVEKVDEEEDPEEVGVGPTSAGPGAT